MDACVSRALSWPNGFLQKGFLMLSLVLIMLSIAAPFSFAAESAGEINKADTAWILVSTAMVMFMTPGLAIFYAGMARKKNVLSTMMQSGHQRFVKAKAPF